VNIVAYSETSIEYYRLVFCFLMLHKKFILNSKFQPAESNSYYTLSCFICCLNYPAGKSELFVLGYTRSSAASLTVPYCSKLSRKGQIKKIYFSNTRVLNA